MLILLNFPSHFIPTPFRLSKYSPVHVLQMDSDWCDKEQRDLSYAGKGGVPSSELHLGLSHVVEGFNSSLNNIQINFYRNHNPERLLINTSSIACKSFGRMNLSIGTSMSSSICLSSRYSAAFLKFISFHHLNEVRPCTALTCSTEWRRCTRL